MKLRHAILPLALALSLPAVADAARGFTVRDMAYLDRHSAPARGLNAIQLEICRAAYLDGRLSDPGQGLVAVVETLALLVRRLAGEVAALGRGGQVAQAAE